MKAIPHWERNGNSAAAAARERGLGVESGDGRDAAGEGERQKGEGEKLGHDYPTKNELYNPAERPVSNLSVFALYHKARTSGSMRTRNCR